MSTPDPESMQSARPEMEAAGEAVEPLNVVAERQFEAIRKVLKERRRSLSISMSELGRQVGVSPSMISQIERGSSLPSVGTLFALAAALGVSVDAFLAKPGAASLPAARRREGLVEEPPRAPEGSSATTREDMYVVRRNKRASVPIRGGVRWERLTPRSLEDVEFLELNYAPFAASDEELYRHPGTEMVLVLEGRFVIHIGFQAYELEEGDSILFPSSLPHRYVNPTDRVSRAVTVIMHEGVGRWTEVSGHEIRPADERPEDGDGADDGEQA